MSDRALALKYDLDNATAAVEDQSFSVKELYSEINALQSSTDELMGNFSGATAEIDENYNSARILTAKLKELTEARTAPPPHKHR